MARRKKIKDGEEFVFCNGAIAKNVSQAKKEVKKLNPDEFSFHVNESKNDLYKWINDCIDTELAKKIENIKDQKEMVAALK